MDKIIKLGEECGLVFTGGYDEELPEFIGEDKQFEKFTNKLHQYERRRINNA